MKNDMCTVRIYFNIHEFSISEITNTIMCTSSVTLRKLPKIHTNTRQTHFKANDGFIFTLKFTNAIDIVAQFMEIY